jgi:hypothetical protein
MNDTFVADFGGPVQNDFSELCVARCDKLDVGVGRVWAGVCWKVPSHVYAFPTSLAWAYIVSFLRRFNP